MLRDLVASIWSWAIIALTATGYGLLAILTSWVPPRGRFYLFWARLWARSILFLTGVPATIETADEAAALPQAIYMSNHESGIDILLLLLVIPQNVRFLAKRSLFYVPFMGWSMWLAGFVPVDRRRTAKAREVLSSLDRCLARGALTHKLRLRLRGHKAPASAYLTRPPQLTHCLRQAAHYQMFTKKESGDCIAALLF